MYTYIYIYVYIYIYMYSPFYIHIYIYMYICICACVCLNIHTCVHIYLLLYIYIYMCVCDSNNFGGFYRIFPYFYTHLDQLVALFMPGVSIHLRIEDFRNGDDVLCSQDWGQIALIELGKGLVHVPSGKRTELWNHHV